MTQNKWVFLLLANLLILFVGCFIDTIAAITILVPILLPIVLKLGIDPVHFGLIITLNLMIGLLHPPLGHGVVRSGTGGATIGRADHDGDPALAGAAASGADRDHLHPGPDSLAAAHMGLAR